MLPLPSISLFKRGLDFASPRFRIRRSLERIFRVDVHSGKKVAPLHGVPSCFHETRAVWCLCSWQDMRAMHDLGGLGREREPFMARLSLGVFPNGCLQGLLDTRRANLAKTSSFWIHSSDMLPRRGIFLSEARFGIHQVKILPPLSIRECIS